jgi:hypothetical protein
MGRQSDTTFQKRQREKLRQQRQKDKEAQRLEARERKANSEGPPRGLPGEDPDLIGIRPGPQPLPEQWSYLPGDPKQPGDDAQDEDK